MLDRQIDDYGGPFHDALPVEDPQTQVSADQFNRVAEDCAQGTRTAFRAIVSFLTDTTSDPKVLDAVSVWGSTTAEAPRVTRGGKGAYQIKYQDAFLDALGAKENVAFRFGHATLLGGVAGVAQIRAIAANVIDVAVFDAGWAQSDLGGGVLLTVWLR